MQPASTEKTKLPPGPDGRRLSNLRSTMDGDYYPQFLDQLHDEYGDIVCFEVPGARFCAIYRGDLVEEVLVEKELSFSTVYAPGTNYYARAPGLTRQVGEAHRRLSQVMRAAFTRERLETHTRTVIEHAGAFCEALRDQAGQSGSDQVVDIRDVFAHHLWAIMLDVVFGRDMKAHPDLGRNISNIVRSDLIWSFLPLHAVFAKLPLPQNLRRRRAIKALDEVAYRAIRRARDTSCSGADVISHLVRARDQGIGEWTFNSDEEIRDEIYSMILLAGDQVINAVMYCIHFISRNPDVCARLEQEVDQVIGTRRPEVADFHKLPYTLATLQESLRLEPPAYILAPRQAVDDCTIGGYFIPKGTQVLVCTRSMQRRKDYWEHATEFRPERWLQNPVSGRPGKPRENYLPFNCQPHQCVGGDFASIISVITLASIARSLRLKAVSDLPLKKNITGVGYLNDPLPVRVEERVMGAPPPRQSPQRPPGPTGRRLANLRRIFADYPGFFDKLYAEYGEVVSFELPGMKFCAVYNYDLMREVLIEQELSFRSFFPRAMDYYLGSPCSIRVRGEEHRGLSNLLRTAFSKERVAVYAEGIVENARSLGGTFLERSGRPAPERVIDLQAQFQHYVLSCIYDTLFGREPKVNPDLGKRLLRIFRTDFVLSVFPGHQYYKQLPLPNNLRRRRVIKALDEVVYRAISRARDPSHPGADVTSHLVRAKEQGLADWAHGSDQEVRDELCTMMLIPPELIVNVLIRAVDAIAQNPGVRQRLEQEIDQALGSRTLEVADFDRLPYTHAVVKEVLRLKTPAHVLAPREALEDCIIGDYLIPAGTQVQVSIRAFQCREDFWEHATEFRPERWLEDSGSGCPRGPETGYMPFSCEHHWCPGANIAPQICVYALAAICQHLRLTPLWNQPLKQHDLSVGYLKGPVQCRAEARNP